MLAIDHSIYRRQLGGAKSFISIRVVAPTSHAPAYNWRGSRQRARQQKVKAGGSAPWRSAEVPDASNGQKQRGQSTKTLPAHSGSHHLRELGLKAGDPASSARSCVSEKQIAALNSCSLFGAGAESGNASAPVALSAGSYFNILNVVFRRSKTTMRLWTKPFGLPPL